ncbi:MAG TPA: phosphatase domain-containing protein [Chitinophagaceae bacterium]
MENHANIISDRRLSAWEKLRRKILFAFRLTDQPTVKIYHGYGNGKKVIVFGHLLLFSPVPRKHYSRNFLTNTFALIRLFIVKPYPKAWVKMQWEGAWIFTQAEDDGFFRFELPVSSPLKPGWHEVQVVLLGRNRDNPGIATGKGSYYIPYSNQFAMISDIDDTFLVSHSSNLRKRLFVLLTENAHSRQPFEGVVRHYQLLARAGARHTESNPFFFVSSSEWNLYDYIREFAIKQQLPQGVYLLNQLKPFRQLWKTGQNNHSTKFMRIVRIIEAYPEQKFILLGDDTQEDPTIYASIVSHFPGKVIAVYLRKVRKKTKPTVLPAIGKMKEAGVHCCYFGHSEEAISDSVSIGLIHLPAASSETVGV